MDNQTSESTPKKVYFKEKLVSQGYCRLCGCINETRHMTNVTSAAAKQKFFVEVIAESCGMSIEKSDGLPCTVCKKCMNFVNIVHQFREKCLDAQNDLKERVSVKKCQWNHQVLSRLNHRNGRLQVYSTRTLLGQHLYTRGRHTNNVNYHSQRKK
jgi:hypothetical protein